MMDNLQCDLVNALLSESFIRKTDEEKRLILDTQLKVGQLQICRVFKSKRVQIAHLKFPGGWYENYKWLCGSVDKNKLFC